MKTTTPAALVEAGDIDRRDSRLRPWTAAAVVVAPYLCFFGASIVAAFSWVGSERPILATTFNTWAAAAAATRQVGAIACTALLLFLVCRWLQIPRALAGLPRPRSTPIPTLLTGLAVTISSIVADQLLNALNPANPNSAAGGVIPSGWAWAGVALDSVHAGVVEEIVIVALPVLVGRRAGWNPAVIIAISIALRWPFHAYHGALASLPWAMVWGGVHVAAYLYWRRLAPLVVLHALKDMEIGYRSAFGDGVADWFDPIQVAILLWLVWRIVTLYQRRRPLEQPTLRDHPDAARFLFRAYRRQLAIPALGALVMVGLLIFSLVQQEWALALVLGVFLALSCSMAYRWVFGCYCVLKARDPSGQATGAALWHVSNGTTAAVDRVAGRMDILATVQHVVAASHRDVIVHNVSKTHRLELKPISLERKMWHTESIFVPHEQTTANLGTFPAPTCLDP